MTIDRPGTSDEHGPRTVRNPREFVALAREIHDSLRTRPVRLSDIRSQVARLEPYAGSLLLKRSVIGEIASIVNKYYPLPEMIALYRREQAVYREHVRNGDFDDVNEKSVLISDLYSLCCWWLKPHLRYPYGDVRLLRPLIGEVLITASDWPRCPYPEQSAVLGQWYEQLSEDGALYPSDEHLAYVQRFEAFAEDIIWDGRGREHITIVNFPAPANALPPTEWWCTQHVHLA